jgi:OmpA-OmpF porin, OOP family
MKKLTICFASLLLSLFGSTQVRVGIMGGYHHNFASPDFYTTDHILKDESLSLRSGHFGVMADIPISKKNWFFQSGVTYFKRGRQQSFTLDTTQTKDLYANARQEQQYLDLPFSVAYKLPLSKSIRFMVGAGPQLSLFLSGMETVSITDTFKVFKEEKQDDLLVGKGAGRYKTSFISLNGFAGFELKNIYLVANYSKGLTDYYDRPNENFRHDSWSGTLGIYLFRSRAESEPKKVVDTDADGIPDTEDHCPDFEGPAVTNGCPDKDGDGIADSKDQCPDKPGTTQYNGCPIPDSDGDGLNDEEDKCPQQAGVRENKGCPVAETTPEPEVKEEVKEVTQEVVEQINMNAKRIAFKFGKAALTAESYAVLDEIVSLLKDTDVKIKIEGHSSLEGNPKSNLKLSQERAYNVKDYLVLKGIAVERISAIGYGSTRPLVKGASEKANVQNRRVEITIEK